jgi:hypothetical protein
LHELYAIYAKAGAKPEMVSCPNVFYQKWKAESLLFSVGLRYLFMSCHTVTVHTPRMDRLVNRSAILPDVWNSGQKIIDSRPLLWYPNKGNPQFKGQYRFRQGS